MTALSISADNGLLNRMRMRVPGDRVSKHHPREGTETFDDIVCIQNHNFLVSKHHPREGTETHAPYDCVIKVVFCNVSKHHPREGTETLSLFSILLSLISVRFLNIIPARGRKLKRCT